MSKKTEYYFNTGDIITDHDTTFNFKIQKFLGKGAFAQCYSCSVSFIKLQNNKKLQELMEIKNACLKITKKSELTSDRLREKLSSEICIQKSLDHPNIVKLYHTFSTTEYIYMVMELCDSTLSDLLKQNKKIRESHTKKFITQLIYAIQYLHGVNVVHRDIKLSNILLKSYTIKLGDFGLCALIQKNKRTTVCGTPNYIAPEIILRTAYSFECDIWSIGVLIYTMLIGIPPFQKKTAKEIYSNIKRNEWHIPSSSVISKEAKDLIKSLLVSDPNKRMNINDMHKHTFFTKKDSLINVVLQNILNNDLILINNEYSICTDIYNSRSMNINNINHDTVTFCIYLSKLEGLGYKMRSNRHGIYFLNGDSIIRKDRNTYIFLTSTIENNKKVLRKEEHVIENMNYFDKVKKKEIILNYFNKLRQFINKFGEDEIINNYEFSFIVRVRRINERGMYLLGLWNNCLVFVIENKFITVYDGKYVECVGCKYSDVKNSMIKALE